MQKEKMMYTLSLEDFKLLHIISKGNYSKTVLVQYAKNNQYYVLRVVKKKYIDEKYMSIIQKTNKILKEIKSSFIVQLLDFFQDTKRVYFLLQYYNHDNFQRRMNSIKKINQQHAKFYIASLILAIEQFHKKKLFYGKIELQNILIDGKGYPRLVFSDHIKLNQKYKSKQSVNYYFAPQKIKKESNQEFELEQDWWSLGILSYQLVSEEIPFDRKQFQIAIVQKDPQIKNISADLQDLIKKLLVKNPKQRLGHNGAKQIKEHSWFKNINWQELIKKQMKSPYIPFLGSSLIQHDDFAYEHRFDLQSESYKQDNENKFAGFSFGGDND